MKLSSMTRRWYDTLLRLDVRLWASTGDMRRQRSTGCEALDFSGGQACIVVTVRVALSPEVIANLWEANKLYVVPFAIKEILECRKNE